jgi:hypothetical protein
MKHTVLNFLRDTLPFFVIIAFSTLLIGGSYYTNETSTRELAPEQGAPSQHLPPQVAAVKTAEATASEHAAVYTYIEIWVGLSVLLMEAYILRLTAVEGRERAHETQERKKTQQDLAEIRSSIESSMKKLSDLSINHDRSTYMDKIASGIMSAEKEVLFASFSMETIKSPNQKRIYDAVLFAQNRNSPGGYAHRGIIAARTEALAGALELTLLTEVELRMCRALCRGDLRFTVFDGKDCIIGYRDGAGKSPQFGETSHSNSVSSTTLADALSTKFNELFNGGETIWEFIDAEIRSGQPKPDIDTVLEWFPDVQFPPNHIKTELMKHCKEL